MRADGLMGKAAHLRKSALSRQPGRRWEEKEGKREECEEGGGGLASVKGIRTVA